MTNLDVQHNIISNSSSRTINKSNHNLSSNMITAALLGTVMSVQHVFGEAVQTTLPCNTPLGETSGHNTITPSGNDNLSCHLKSP
jgi:hypothetical protein